MSSLTATGAGSLRLTWNPALRTCTERAPSYTPRDTTLPNMAKKWQTLPASTNRCHTAW